MKLAVEKQLFRESILYKSPVTLSKTASGDTRNLYQENGHN